MGRIDNGREPTMRAMGDNPLVSVIIPAFNSERFLGATISSVLAQSIQNWECVIVDDGSTDKTLCIAKEYEAADDRIRVLGMSNRGPSAARNRGYQNSKESKFVVFMDADDMWLPNALEKLHAELEKFPEAIGVHGLAEFVDEEGNPMNSGEWARVGQRRRGLKGGRYVELNLEEPTTFNVLSIGNTCFPPGVILIRREAFGKTSGFDERIKGPEDWDMLARLSRHGDLRFLNEVVLLYRRHGENLGAMAGIAEAAWRVRCKIYFSEENTSEQRFIVKAGWRAYQIFMLGERLRQAKESWKAGSYWEMVLMLLRIPIIAIRYVRGGPLRVQV